MSNKSQLQLNNETLASILSAVAGLPTQESLKHGAYVWKKYINVPAEYVTNPTFKLTVSTTSPATISEANFDVSKIEDYINFFNEFADTNLMPNQFSISNDSLKFTYGAGTSSSYVNSFDGEQSTMDLKVLMDTYAGTYTLSYSGTKLLCSESKTFLNFVVSDDPTAYPDGGEQDGYWYETFDLKSFGIDFGEVTLTSSNLSSVTVAHNLGVVPSYVALIPRNLTFTRYYTSANINGRQIYGNSSSAMTIQYNDNTLTENEITFAAYGTFLAVDYYWIAIA